MNIEYILLPVLTVVLTCFSGWLLVRNIRKNWPEEKRDGIKKTAVIYSAVMALITIAITVLLMTIYKDNSIWTKIKIIILISIVWPIGLIDSKTYLIPDAFILTVFVCRVMLIPFELLFAENPVWQTLLSEAIAAAALVIAALLCSLLIYVASRFKTKDAIGVGDIKLFAIMGMTLGLEGTWSAIFITMVVAFFAVLFLMIFKKKKATDKIPFGPAIIIGIYLSVILTGL